MSRVRNFRSFTAAAVLSIATLATAGTNHTYIPNLPYTGGHRLNIGEVSDLWFANSFDAAPGGEWLTRLDVSFQNGLPAGTPISLLVYADPNHDGDPADLQLLQQVTGTVGNGGSGDIYSPQAFSIPATYVSGDFFVAVQANNAPSSAYLPLDLDHPQGRSFLALNDAPHAGTLNPAQVQSADLPPIKLEDLLGLPSNMFNVFIGARGRSTQYVKAQDPLVFDSFSDGDFSISSNGIQLPATAVGGKRGATVVNGTTSVSNGLLTVAGGQASIFYGFDYYGGSGYQGGPGPYLHANLDGYDILRMHFANPNSTVIMVPPINAGNGNPQSFHIDADGNVDFSITGQDWTDFNTLSFTLYSYGLGTITLDSISLVATPLPGDVNGDDLLNADDYILLDRGFANHLAGHVNGDLTGDGLINAADYLQIDTALALQNGGHLSPDFLQQRESQFGESYVSQLIASVPEPTSALACLVAMLPTFTRRRK